MLYVVQGIVLTTAAVTLVSLQQERLSRGLRLLTGGRSMSLRLGLAYPLARRSRTGLTIAMYALVVFILTFITALAHMINNELDDGDRRACRAALRGRHVERREPDHPGATDEPRRRHARGAAGTDERPLPGRRP